MANTTLPKTKVEDHVLDLLPTSPSRFTQEAALRLVDTDCGLAVSVSLIVRDGYSCRARRCISRAVGAAIRERIHAAIS